MTERQRMLQGESYNPLDRELAAARREARQLTDSFNAAATGKQRQQIMRKLFAGEVRHVWIEPPFFCDYGAHIHFGSNVFLNFNCVILDPAPVAIGNNVFFGPGVHIYTANHPLDAVERRSGLENALPVTIGNDVWIGGGAIVLPGVSVGAGTVVGAGSVVTRSLPAGVLAAGNPCRIIREITASDLAT